MASEEPQPGKDAVDHHLIIDLPCLGLTGIRSELRRSAR